MVFYGLGSTKPKNFRPKNLGMCHQRIRRRCLQFHASIRAARACTCHTRPQHCDVMDVVILHYLLTHLSRFNPDRPGLTRIRTPWKKKIKLNKKNALTKRTFDHDQKVKNFKRDLSHSIFQVHSNFGTHFFIQGSKIVQTSNFQKS